MKSADVSGRAIPPQVCHSQAAAGAPGQVEGYGRTGTIAAAKAEVAARIARAAPRTIDGFARDAMRAFSILHPRQAQTWVIQLPERHAASVAGYAPAPRAAAAQGAAGTSASGSTSSHGDWDFLDDPRLSIEDKLFRFMKLVMKKSNDELEEKMKAFKSGRTSGSAGSTQSKSSGGLFGFLKQVIPPLGELEKVIPGLPGMVNQVAGQLGPQILAALTIPLGAPWLAPAVQRAASALLPAVLGAAGGSDGASGSSGSGGSGGVSKENDERMQLMEIERLMQKTNQMFATVSNILKATHDAAMTAVNNIR